MSLEKKLLSFLNKSEISYASNISLSEKTWIGFGGNVLFWVVPKTKEELVLITSFFYKENIPFDVVGATSNCVFSKQNQHFCVIDTRNVRGITFLPEDGLIECDCGESLSSIVKRAVRAGIQNFAGLVGIPGTVGGATVNNSGARGDIMSRIVSELEVIMPDGGLQWISAERLAYRHRSSTIKRGELKCVILSVKLLAEKGDLEAETIKMQEAIKARSTHQESKLKNLGSVFATEKGLYREIAEFYPVYKFGLRICEIVLSRLAKVFTKLNPHKWLNKLTMIYFRKKLPVSQYGLNCFVRGNNIYEEDFFDYIEWISGLTKHAVKLEVEIKEGHRLL